MQSDDETVRMACIETAKQVLQFCEAKYAKYGFDAEEEERALNLDQIKIQRKRGAPSKKSVPKKTKAVDGKPKGKRAPTGYLMYANSIRSEVRARLTDELKDEALQRGDEAGKLQPQVVVTAIATQWKSESKETVSAWKAQAAAAGAESGVSEGSEAETE